MSYGKTRSDYINAVIIPVSKYLCSIYLLKFIVGFIVCFFGCSLQFKIQILKCNTSGLKDVISILNMLVYIRLYISQKQNVWIKVVWLFLNICNRRSHIVSICIRHVASIIGETVKHMFLPDDYILSLNTILFL